MNTRSGRHLGVIFLFLMVGLLAATIYSPSRAKADESRIFLPSAGEEGVKSLSCVQLQQLYEETGEGPCPCQCPTATPTPTWCPATPNPTQTPINEFSGRLQQYNGCGGWELVDCAGAQVIALSCAECATFYLHMGQWVKVATQRIVVCDPGGFAYDVSSIYRVTDPCQATPTPVLCDSSSWDFRSIGPPEDCRWFDSGGLPVRFNIEKRILLPSGVTQFVENSFYLMAGYTGYIVGEGDRTIYCEGTSEAVVRQDMIDHMARRRLDPDFIRDAKTIGEVTVAQATAWGILRSDCVGVAVCPNVQGDVQHLPLSTSSTYDVNPDADRVGIIKLWTNRDGMSQTTFRAKFKVDQPVRVRARNGGDVTYWDACCQYQVDWNWQYGGSAGMPEVTIQWFKDNGYLEWLALPPGGAQDCGAPLPIVEGQYRAQ